MLVVRSGVPVSPEPPAVRGSPPANAAAFPRDGHGPVGNGGSRENPLPPRAKPGRAAGGGTAARERALGLSV